MLGIAARVGVLALGGTLALASVGRAAPVVFDVTAHASVHTVITLAATPGDVVSPALYPSSVSLDVGDGGAVTLLGGTLHYQLSVALGNNGILGTVVTDEFLILPGGALGTLSGDEIVWGSTPIRGELSGTFTCGGAFCALAGLPPDSTVQISDLSPYVYFPVLTEPFRLGTWLLSPGHDQILGSTRMVLATADAGSGNPPPGTPIRWVVVGDTDLGYPAPEPSALALALAGGLALAAQRATMAR